MIVRYDFSFGHEEKFLEIIAYDLQSTQNRATLNYRMAYRMLIGGKLVESESGATREVVQPSSGKRVVSVPEATKREVDEAVRAARAAFDKGAWPEMTAQQRGRLLFRIADVIRKNADHLAKLETLNVGKPIVESEFDINDTISCFEYYGGLATKITGLTLPVPDQAISMTLREPLGVCALIVPWNYPLMLAAWKLAPALAAGCTVVLKPAEQTPLTTLEFGKLLQEIDIPPGVINIISGSGETVGAALVQHPLVDKVAFTGGTQTGCHILKGAASSNLKKVSLELGGKSPNIFFDDADLEASIDGALFGLFINQGEVCSAGSRILVQQSIHKEFVKRLILKAKSIRLGDPMDRKTKMGPLVTAEHRDQVLRYIQIGVGEGAKLILGGGPPKSAALKKGFYIEPTIFDHVKNSMRIAREEIFGPVVCIIPFKDEEEAVSIANDTPYGLAGAVWSRDIFRALRVTRRIRAGIIWINTMQPCYVEAPWGGYKQSGWGRELGPHAVDEYLETKQVHINLNEKPIGWY
jgi:betaine-aldehyde dehydrogenase